MGPGGFPARAQAAAAHNAAAGNQPSGTTQTGPSSGNNHGEGTENSSGGQK